MNRSALHVCGALLLVSAVAGCGRELNTEYGKRRPAGSVNGVEVFGKLFEAAGHKVTSWPWLSPRLAKKADCIVWFQTDYDGPPERHRQWLERWLKTSPQHTLIVVNRDYDSAVDYWKTVRQGTTGEEFSKLSRRLADAQGDFQTVWGRLATDADAGWFKLNRAKPMRKATQLAGEPQWLSDVDRQKTNIELRTRLSPTGRYRKLLYDGEDVIAASQRVGKGRLIAIVNGSFLLNLPLVNREHRKLAAHLVDELGGEPRQVAFIECQHGLPPIYEKEPDQTNPSMFRYFGLWPLNLILLQLALLGTIFLFRRAPIFGLPREDNPDTLTDFGQHVEAVGGLLARTQDAAFAKERVTTYETISRRAGEHEKTSQLPTI